MYSDPANKPAGLADVDFIAFVAQYITFLDLQLMT